MHVVSSDNSILLSLSLLKIKFLCTCCIGHSLLLEALLKYTTSGVLHLLKSRSRNFVSADNCWYHAGNCFDIAAAS